MAFFECILAPLLSRGRDALKMLAWTALAFCVAGFVGAFLSAKDSREFRSAQRVDGTITDYKNSGFKSAGGGTSALRSVGISFTKTDTHFYFSGFKTLETNKSKYPIGSIHNVWVTESRRYTQRKTHPGTLSGAHGAVAFGLVSGLLSAFLFRRSQGPAGV